jgi:hypothetical protein
MIQKHTKIFLSMALVCMMGFSVYANNVFAEPVRQPEWQRESASVDVTAFQYLMHVPPVAVVVPTVVSISMPTQEVNNRSSAVTDSSGALIHSLFKVEGENQYASVKVLGNGTNPMALTDGKLNTTSDFPVEGFVEGGENIVGIVFLFSENIKTSELHITPAPNTTLPETVLIEASKMESTGDIEVVVSKKRLDGWVVQFPEVITNKIMVTFTLSQPLRLSEMEFVQKTDTVYKETVRFLAQPGEEYTVYLSADRVYEENKVSLEGANLSSDKDVLELSGYTLVRNPQYVRADVDNDGIPDLQDNCVSVPNRDQADIDRNGQGDACDDFDKDGIITIKDNCPETPNRDQRDTDHDGVGDACDIEESRLTEKNPWIPWVGMGIAGLVLIGLLVVSLKTKPIVPAQSESAFQKKDEENEGGQEEGGHPQE